MNRLLITLIALWMLAACGFSSNNKNDSSSDISTAADTFEIIKTLAVNPDTNFVSYLLGKFEPAEDSLFVRLQDIHTAGAAKGAFLRTEAYEAFVRMHEAAKAENINLIIKSATRNFYYQKGIWEMKWNGKILVNGKNLARDIKDPFERALLILQYSSMPGTSRHHWGTDVDLNALTNGYFEKGQGKKEYEWLRENAQAYGFCQPYSPKGENRPFGYEEEKWHWSYMPLSTQLLQNYEILIRPGLISDFDGAVVADSLRVIEKYVMGVADECKF